MNKNWQIIKSTKWGKTDDYEKIGAKLAKEYTLEELETLQEFYEDKRAKLCTKLDKYSEKRDDKYDYWGCSDDGFWDLTAHIVGLGEVEYNKVLKNPELAKKRSDKGDYQENFGYCLSYAIELKEEAENS